MNYTHDAGTTFVSSLAARHTTDLHCNVPAARVARPREKENRCALGRESVRRLHVSQMSLKRRVKSGSGAGPRARPDLKWRMSGCIVFLGGYAAAAAADAPRSLMHPAMPQGAFRLCSSYLTPRSCIIERALAPSNTVSSLPGASVALYF